MSANINKVKTTSSQHTLDLDMGNTFTKWRYGEETGKVLGQAIPSIEGTVERIRVSNVVADKDSIAEQIQSQLGVQAEFAVSQASFGDLLSGYADPSQLGVDRWLAMIAARSLTKKPCLVIDAGTALTIDLIDGSGQHLGGHIVPGFETCLRLLKEGTQDVAVQKGREELASLELGTNTKDAVIQGALCMLSDFIQQTVLRSINDLSEEVTLIGTGGDLPLLKPHLKHQIHHEPDLVLNGLALALP